MAYRPWSHSPCVEQTSSEPGKCVFLKQLKNKKLCSVIYWNWCFSKAPKVWKLFDMLARFWNVWGVSQAWKCITTIFELNKTHLHGLLTVSDVSMALKYWSDASIWNVRDVSKGQEGRILRSMRPLLAQLSPWHIGHGHIHPALKRTNSEPGKCVFLKQMKNKKLWSVKYIFKAW